MNYEDLELEQCLIYVGPTVFALGLMRFMGFRGGVSGAAEAAVKEIPDIAKLIVPAEKLEQARADIERKGSYLNAVYGRVVQAINKLGRK